MKREGGFNKLGPAIDDLSIKRELAKEKPKQPTRRGKSSEPTRGRE